MDKRRISILKSNLIAGGRDLSGIKTAAPQALSKETDTLLLKPTSLLEGGIFRHQNRAAQALSKETDTLLLKPTSLLEGGIFPASKPPRRRR